MTSRLSSNPAKAGTLEVFPDFPPRDDMQNALHLYDDGHQAIVRRFFGNTDTTIILSEIPVRWAPGQVQGHRIPDFLIAFNVNRPRAVEQNGYSISDQGKPPDFVLEVASVRTADNDVTGKRRDYANFGIPEYWRFDPTGGDRYGYPLAGDQLVGEAYQPIEILEVEPGHFHGGSDVLGLSLCWDHGKLRWFDHSTEQHLLLVDEGQDALIEEREARIAEREARLAEREARLAAEARVRELEEQLKARGQG